MNQIANFQNRESKGRKSKIGGWPDYPRPFYRFFNFLPCLETDFGASVGLAVAAGFAAAFAPLAFASALAAGLAGAGGGPESGTAALPFLPFCKEDGGAVPVDSLSSLRA